MEITKSLVEGANGEIFLDVVEDQEGYAKAAHSIHTNADGWTKDRTMRCNLSLPPREYYLWEQREPGCWQDANFVRSYMKEHPEYCASNSRRT